MRRVFDGGVGWVSGGIVERSRDRGVRDLDEGPDDMFGELSADIIKEEGVYRQRLLLGSQ